MTNSSPKEVGKQYFKLDPSRLAPVDTLYQITDALEPYTGFESASRSRFGLIKAHSHMELSIHPEVIPTEQRDQALQAQEILTATNSDNHFLVKGSEADRSRLFLPAFTEGWTDNLRTDIQTSIAQDLRLISEERRRSEVGNRKKPLYAKAVALLLDYGGLEVRPSLLRQHSSDSAPQDKPYRWDVTAISDAGEYRLYMRSKAKRGGAGKYQRHIGAVWNNYHPDIIRITPSQLVDPPEERHHQFMVLCQNLISLDKSKTPPPNVRHALRGIVTAMQEKNPIVTSTEDITV